MNFWNARQFLLLIALLLPAAGCMSLSKKKLVPESLATCRELSRDGVAAMQLEQWDRAQQLLSDAVESSPTDIDARRQYAEVLWQQGDRRNAVVHMEAAVRLDGKHAPTIVRSGEMLLEIGAIDHAMQRAEEAILLEPTLAGAWALRGQYYRRQGELELALADFLHALQYSSQQTEILQQVAEIQYATGRPQRCLSTLHHLLDIYPAGKEPQRALWLEGLAYGSLNRHRDAVQSLHAASLRDQPQADLLYHLALAEQASQHYSAAESSARMALALQSDHEPSRQLLSQLSGIATAKQAAETVRR